MWSQQGGDTGVAWNVGAGVCDHVGKNIGYWSIGIVMVVIKVVVDGFSPNSQVQPFGIK